MSDVTDLRKNERFAVVQPLDGAFGNIDVALLNLALGGAQLEHEAPLRIGTRGRLVFHCDDVSVELSGSVVWSKLAPTPEGLRYKSGVQLDPGEVHYATALHTLLRRSVVARDTDSLDRKREREAERARRKTGPGMTPLPPSVQ